uniref:N-acetylneuraminate synthase n=1 Tax=Algoriphagus sp. TaxID=1872435 RepID=UPI0040477958
MGKVIIIAEAGVNHNGDINLAKKLIDVAVEASVDYVKFQTFRSENLVSKSAKKADYQIENTQDSTENQLEMLKKLELSHEQHVELMAYCAKKKISFFSTAFDLESLIYLKELGLTMVKIPSGEITNLPFLRKASELFSKVIISTGMSTMGEIEDALNVFLNAGIKKENIYILHCNTEYPTPMKDVNLLAMLAIKKRFNVEVGYSDHTLGIEVPIAAVALGAKMVEKHFTLDRSLPGPDQLASIEPEELKAMVIAIRNIELSISGDGQKKPSKSEIKNLILARKSIHVNKNLYKGQIITKDDIVSLRPGIGISPMYWDNVIGKKLKIDKNEFDVILFSDLI